MTYELEIAHLVTKKRGYPNCGIEPELARVYASLPEGTGSREREKAMEWFIFKYEDEHPELRK